MMWLALLVGVSHGTWVYKIDGRALQATDVTELIAFAQKHQLNEVYVSLGALPLDGAETPRIISSLKEAGLRVEALIDDPVPKPVVERIVAYNEKRSPDTAFDGVHYDFEPWIGKGKDTAWYKLLIERYQEARQAAKNLSFTADISGAKLAQLPEKVRKQVLDAAGRVVTMEYDTPIERVLSRSDAHLTENARIVVALHMKDFKCDTPAQLQALEKKLSQRPAYAGWAIYDYNHRLSCPSGAAK